MEGGEKIRAEYEPEDAGPQSDVCFGEFVVTLPVDLPRSGRAWQTSSTHVPRSTGFFPMSENEKGAFRADISDEAVAEALRAIEGNSPDEPTAVELEVEAPPGADEAANEEVDPVQEEIRQQELLLEEAARRQQETMARLKEANEARLRALADLENFKKRAQREKEEVQRFGIERLLSDLIPVLDNFDRAIEHAEASNDVASFAEGVAMIRRVFEETLARHGVKGFSAVGEPFDPRFHEAIQQVESREHPANVVVQEVVRGYLLHDRLIRPAMVTVSSGPGPESAGE